MPNICIDPSSLHLKKELNVLRKARCFRDPETSSSWRSPISSRSVVGGFNWNCADGAQADSNRVNTSESLDAKADSNGVNTSESLEPSTTPPLRTENDQQKVFLYNWRHQYGMSKDNAVTLDGEKDMEGFTRGSPQDSLHDGDSRSDAGLDGPITVLRVKTTTSEATRRRVTRKFKSTTKEAKRFWVRNSLSSEQLDLPSSSLRSLSIGLSDGTEYSPSEDFQFSDHKFPWRVGNTSHMALQILSRCKNKPYSSKHLRITRKEDSSCSYTPASTSSCKRYGPRCTSTVGSWDGSTPSPHENEMDQLDLPRNKGCGIPCYWPRRSKHGRRVTGSPSLSETLRRTGSSILCGSRTRHHKRRPATSTKRKSVSKSIHSLPLLTNGCDGGWSSIDSASAEFISDFGELHLEASSRLDGRRRSSCISQDELELSPMVGAHREPNSRSLSMKYKPRSFDELVGHDAVVQSLTNAIKRGRIAPSYLFQGPNGTGKTSTARVFAVALNCLSAEEKKPCGSCSKCSDFTSGKSADVLEVDATNKRGMNKVWQTLKNLSGAHSFSQYTVFIVSGCHMLPSKVLTTFLQFLEGPPSHVVFIFITSYSDSFPKPLASRCRKYFFPKIKDSDIVSRLRKLSAEENIDAELDALDLIASNSDGSLKDAEMMLDQLSSMGKRITASLVNDFVGVVLDEKLLDLLALAMSSDTAETVKRAHELMDSGVDPVTLMSQLANLIMDIIGGTYQLGNAKSKGASICLRSLTESEVKRLKQALKILSEAEKQLRLSSECSTWFTAALVQLSSGNYSDASSSGSKDKQNHKKIKENITTSATERPRKSTSAPMVESVNGHHGSPSSSFSVTEGNELDSSCKAFMTGKRAVSYVSYEKLEEIWRLCIERCHSNTLRQLLGSYGKLVSISDAKGFLIVYIAFANEGIKSRAERFLSSITNSIETVLRRDVEVRIGLIGDHEGSPTGKQAVKSQGSASVILKQMELAGEMEKDRNSHCNRLSISSYKSMSKEQKPSRKSFNGYEDMVQRIPDSFSSSVEPDGISKMSSLAIFSADGNIYSTRERRHDGPLHSTIEDLRLESAWLQAAEKGTPSSAGQSRPERNQILPQDGAFCKHEGSNRKGLAVSPQNWDELLNHEIKSLEMNNKQHNREEQNGARIGHYPMSPSLLHNNSLRTNFNSQNQEYGSGPGCSGLLCWKTTKPFKVKVKQRTRVHRRYLWFGPCGKPKTMENRIGKQEN